MTRVDLAKLGLTVPHPALVLLVGPSGAGKSTFAAAHFKSSEIVSSDALREMLTGDAGDQTASAEAFHLLTLIVDCRLSRGLTTVIDATNLRAAHRKRYLRLAARYGIPSVAIAFDLPQATYLLRNAARPERVVGGDVVNDQAERMAGALADLSGEGYAAVHVLNETAAVGSLRPAEEADRGARSDRARARRRP